MGRVGADSAADRVERKRNSLYEQYAAADDRVFLSLHGVLRVYDRWRSEHAGELVADSVSSRPACSSFNLEIPGDVVDAVDGCEIAVSSEEEKNSLLSQKQSDHHNMFEAIPDEDECFMTGVIIEPADDIDAYMFVEQMPEFPGGEEKMIEFVQDNVVYPQQAKDAGVEGRVFVAFIVETDGSLSDVKVLHGIGHGCDEAAVEVVQLMPKWKPGFHNGEAVRVKSLLPISFQLNNPSKN